ncbi:MAG: glycosyltransferase family 4 protein [Methanobacterium sp.]
MKIAFLNHSFILGSGIDTVIYELARHLGYDHEVTLFTYYNQYDTRDLNFEVKEISIPFKENRVSRSVISPIYFNKVAEIRKSISDFDVINTHLYPANLIPLIPTKLKKPLHIVTEWSEPGINPNYEFTQQLYKKLINKMNNYAANKADAVLAPCDFVKKWVKQEYNVEAEKIYLDGVNFDIFDMKKPYEPIESLNNFPVILYVGRIDPYKNIHILIESFEIVKKNFKDAKLVIVGKKHFTDYSQRIEKIVKEKNLEKDVILTGVVSWEDLPRYFVSCDIYATCSSWEGFLRAEAFAMGKPMVAFDVGANSDTIDDGENGILVYEQTPKAFAQALIELASNDNLRKTMGENGYKWAKENLDFNKIAVNFASYAESRLSNGDSY